LTNYVVIEIAIIEQ